MGLLDRLRNDSKSDAKSKSSRRRHSPSRSHSKKSRSESSRLRKKERRRRRRTQLQDGQREDPRTNPPSSNIVTSGLTDDPHDATNLPETRPPETTTNIKSRSPSGTPPRGDDIRRSRSASRSPVPLQSTSGGRRHSYDRSRITGGSTPVVIDMGSGFVKAGFGGDDAPTSVFSSVVGAPRKGHFAVIVGSEIHDVVVGERAEQKRGILHLKYPVKHGVWEDFDGVTHLMDHVFSNELGVDSNQQCVLLSEPPYNPVKNRELSAEIMFETFDVPGLYFQMQAALALYASGRTTGLICDVGHGATQVVPIFEGYCAPHGIQRLHMGGYDLTKFLMKLLHEDGLNFVSTSEREIVRDLKEQIGYVSMDWEGDLRRMNVGGGEREFEEEYVLPDGKRISVGAIRFIGAEPLFKPFILGIESPGIHELVMKSILACDIDLHRGLLENIVLSGGSTLFPNFADRFKMELDPLLADFDIETAIVAPPERKYSTWIGGSICASLSSFDEHWVTKEEFFDNGGARMFQRLY